MVEDTRLTKAADLAAKQHVLLASDVPDAWKRPQLKAVGRQLRLWNKKVRQPFGAPVSGMLATGAPATSPGEDDFDAGPVQPWLTQLVKTARGIKQSASPGGSSRPGRKPPVPPKPSFCPSTRKRLKFTLEASTEELAKELPFSEEPGPEPWDTPSDRVASIKKSIKRNIRKRGDSRRQTKRPKSSQESPGVENVENPVMGRTQRWRAAPRSRRRRRCWQRGGKLFDVQKLLTKTGMEFLLARLSVHGTWDPFGKTIGPR